jgi:Uma2 family endonuclease
MHMATKTHRWSRADLERLPDDGNRYEVLDGQLFVTPSPLFPHQWIATRLIYLLIPYVEGHGLGSVVGPGAVVFGDNELLPDVAVVPIDPAGAPEKWEHLPRAILVVEVLSRTTRRRDVVEKRAAYQRLRIPTYWVIDRFQRRALVWEPESRESIVVTDALRWRPRGDIEPLVIPVADLLPPTSTTNTTP